MNKATRFISNILFDKEIDLVSFPLKTNHQFWDSFVKIGSSHYVIPTLYYKLKQRNYLNLLNNELVSYLKEIYNQNLKRNIELVKESQEISSILKQNNIDHVFLKGTALISSIYSDKLGDRMIGDIDILVDKSQILKAKSLLVSNGNYNTQNFTEFTPFMPEEKHLHRMISENKLFAIELHFDLTRKKNIDLSNFIATKKNSAGINIPNNINLLNHIIINFQKNDHGSLKAGFHFRTLFDVFNLSKIHPGLIDKVPNSPHLSRIKIIMKNLNILKFKIPLKLITFDIRFKLIHSYYVFSLLNSTLTNIVIILSVPITSRVKQIKALFLQKDYRKYALKKIRIIK